MPDSSPSAPASAVSICLISRSGWFLFEVSSTAGALPRSGSRSTGNSIGFSVSDRDHLPYGGGGNSWYRWPSASSPLPDFAAVTCLKKNGIPAVRALASRFIAHPISIMRRPVSPEFISARQSSSGFHEYSGLLPDSPPTISQPKPSRLTFCEMSSSKGSQLTNRTALGCTGILRRLSILLNVMLQPTLVPSQTFG